MSAPVACAACGNPVQFERSIHRDGFCEGPEVWICNDCGNGLTPTCPQLWRMIRERIADGHVPTVNDGTRAAS